MLNRAQIQASNNRIENLRFRRGMRGLSIAAAGAGLAMAALCDGMNQFRVAMIAAAFPDRPWYVPLWLYARWLKIKYRYLTPELPL